MDRRKFGKVMGTVVAGMMAGSRAFADETASGKTAKTDVKDSELKLAQQLIEQQASDTFDPSAYKDEVRERIEAAVQKKVEGQEITLAEAPEPGGAQVIDLMEALRASLGKKAPAAAKPAPAAAEKRKPPKRAASPAEAAPARKRAKR